ncbi:hypothetical protein [Nostoc sp. MS1]|uniref:hypothetical protein n=1 Tax=Nostoc sp. MS1 TaxID=2764711 RepID=UPI001CC416A0|nr:hypothetical protein [Nostoc sp. MS1]BCL34369.1 hypothetical protein NSMS1_08160 [Nostoc sp. MS1]
MNQNLWKIIGAVTGTVFSATILEIPVLAATVTYDFTVRLFPSTISIPSGLPDTYSGFFSYDTDSPITTPSGDRVFPLTNFSFSFIEPINTIPTTFIPRIYNLSDLVTSSASPLSFAFGDIPTGTPPTTSLLPGGFVFNLNFPTIFVDIQQQVQGIFIANLPTPGNIINSLNLVTTFRCPDDVIGCEPPSEQLVGEFVSLTLREGEPPIADIAEPTAIAGLLLFGLGFLSQRKFGTSQHN